MAAPFQMTWIIFTTLLIANHLTPSSAQGIPSYTEIVDRAAAIAGAVESGTASRTAKELRERWPLLFSPTLFQHELVKLTEHFARNSSWVETLLSANVSAVCVDHLVHTVTALAEREGWAWQMVDAMGKPFPDLKGLNLNWVGAYKECLNVDVLNISSSHPNSSTPLFRGRYCSANIIELPSPSPLPSQLMLGVCIPDSCSSNDLTILLNTVLLELKVSPPLYGYSTCQEPDQPLDRMAVAGFVVVGLFVVLMLLGTMVDIVYTQMPKWRAERLNILSTNFHHSFYNHNDDVILLGSLPAKIPEPDTTFTQFYMRDVRRLKEDGSFGLSSAIVALSTITSVWRLAVKLLTAFSVYTNGAKLLSTKQVEGSLDCVHGIRFLSMTWVVLGHCFIFQVSVSANLVGYFSEVIKRWTFQGIANATVSVDSFFVLSGLLVSYLSLRELKRSGGRMNWFKFYFHRFWRLTPPYMLIIFVYLSLGKYWGSGPQWLDKQPDRDNCKTSWWTNMLYINNFVDADKTCLGQSWYLANDMQFYILSPLIFVPLYCSPVFGIVSVLVFLLATTVTPAALTMKDHFPPGGTFAGVNASPTGANYMTDFYIKPYNRMGPYIIGMLTGYLLYRTDCKVKINKVVNLLCWAVATATALAVLYGLYHATQGHPVSLPESAFYNSVARTAWGAALAWVIFACVTGYGGFVNTILSWKALVPLSRLTYCIYLLHIMLMYAYTYSRDTVFYYSDANIVALFLSVLVACYMVSAVVSLAFEAPMMALEKVILNHKKRE